MLQRLGRVGGFDQGMTLRQAVAAGALRLSEQGELAPTAGRDAELLLLHAVQLPRSTIYAYPGRLLSDVEQAAYAAAIERRLGFEPIQYITGTQEFFGMALEVGSGVLIPRPETELLRVLDVGTGTGALAIALATHLPLAEVVAVDVSAVALGIAGRNVARHGVGDRVELAASDLLRDLPQEAGLFDAIVSNPPYVPEGDRAGLHPQVRDHEPAEALFAGADGLAVYRRLIPEARGALVEGGLLAMEIGQGQSAAMRELLKEWHAAQVFDDLQGIARVVVARRP